MVYGRVNSKTVRRKGTVITAEIQREKGKKKRGSKERERKRR